MTSYLLPNFFYERNIEPTILKKAKPFKSFKFDDLQLLEIMKFFGGATSLDSFLKAKKTSETKGFFFCEWFDHPAKCRIQNYPLMKFSAKNFAVVTLLKPITRTMLTFWKMSWPQNNPLSNWNYQNQPLMEMRSNNTCDRHWSKNKWAHAGNFSSGITKKRFFPTLETMQKRVLFTTTKISICWSLVVHYQTWPTFA